MSDDASLGTVATLPVSAAEAATVRGGDVELRDVDASLYELGKQLGAGGMGKVLLARDRRLDRHLAIKVSQTRVPAVRARFTREAVLTARLQHPSIIPVHEAGVLDGEPFYAMKHVKGHSLAQLIEKTRTLDERLALVPKVIAVADALAYAHAQRVIHRDLKPDNVIVGDYGETIVIDWGLAKELGGAVPDDDDPAPRRPSASTAASDDTLPAESHQSGTDSLTVAGAAMGTPSYMAPEQAAGEPVDERADVYGLGAMLYHVLCGAPPYTGRSADAIMDAVLAGPPQALAARQPGIPVELLAIVGKAMAREAADRYPSAIQLAADLRSFERGQLVAAHVYSRGQLLRRWIARHRVAIAIAAVVAVVAGLWLRSELRDRRAREQRVAEVLRRDAGDLAIAQAQTDASEFAAAERTHDRRIQQLAGETDDELAQRRATAVAERERVHRVAVFYRRANDATFLSGDEDKGARAIMELQGALTEAGALDEAGRYVAQWWESVPLANPEQRKQLVHEAYRQLLLLAFLHFKEGGLAIKLDSYLIAKSPVAAAHFRACLEILRHTPDLERFLEIRPAQAVLKWHEIATTMIGHTGTDADIAAAKALELPAPGAIPASFGENATDWHFLGAGHFFWWQLRDTFVGRGFAGMFPKAFEYDHALAEGIHALRIAILIDPRQYWPHFLLGWALREQGDPTGAGLAFDTCIMLQPRNPLGFGQRAQAFAEAAAREPEERRARQLAVRAHDDAAEMHRLAPHWSVTYWSRADMLRFLGRHAEAIAAYTHALELEDDPGRKFTRQVAIGQLPSYVDALDAIDAILRELLVDETDADATADRAVLRAFAALADHTTSATPVRTIEHAESALALRPRDARALALRGTGRLARKDAAAREDFDAALRIAPTLHLAALGRARSLDESGSPEARLAAYDALLVKDGDTMVAATEGQQLVAHLGRHRALVALGRQAEADAALARARALDPLVTVDAAPGRTAR